MTEKMENVLNCSQSNKNVKNKSVYCKLLDQWVAVNYCEYACRAYEIKEKKNA